MTDSPTMRERMLAQHAIRARRLMHRLNTLDLTDTDRRRPCPSPLGTTSVTIGDNTVVGAGAVVIRDLAANVVAIGTPARIVKTLTP